MAKHSQECYDMRSARKGLMLCALSNPDHGGDSDMRVMRDFFGQFGFGGYGANIIPNASARDIRDHIQQFRNNIMRDPQHISCVLVSVSCHGNLVELQGVDQRLTKVSEIIEPFNDKNCPRLKGIPKIFILDACRGYFDGREQIADRGVYRNSPRQGPTQDDKDIRDLRTNYSPPVINHMLTVYPTMSGYKAFCGPDGSFLYKCIQKVFLDEWSHNRGNHLDDLFMQVNRKLLEGNARHDAVVVLVVESTLRKLIYLE